VRADRDLAVAERARHRGVEDLVDQRALPAPTLRSRAEDAQRERDGHVLEVVLARADELDCGRRAARGISIRRSSVSSGR
jgi:hypothetical protein